jgi:DNA polymerase-3 subunit delta'
MIWERIRGHDVQEKMFRRAAARGRLAHAYLFVGPEGIGKQLFARTLAQCLFCERIADADLDACGECPACRQMQAGTHPDFLSIGVPAGKKILPISLLVGDDSNRGRTGLCYEIAMSPMSGTRRIAVINDAQAMNEEAANSLLKTLEEPPPGSVLILLTPETEAILPTIRSRCQPVRFTPLNDDLLRELLQQQYEIADPVDDILPMAQGSLEAARQLLEPGLQTLWKAVASCLQQEPLDPVQGIQAISAALEELGGETSVQRENMRTAVTFCIESLRRQLTEARQPEQLDKIGEMLDRCFEADLHLQKTMPIPLCLESLVMELGRRSRSAAPSRL